VSSNHGHPDIAHDDIAFDLFDPDTRSVAVANPVIDDLLDPVVAG